jgi:hydrogenase/urease accessory protein HupE
VIGCLRGPWRVAILPLLVLLLGLGTTAPAAAHEFRPGYLELREQDPSTFALLWKRPSGGEVEIRIVPVVPAGCSLSGPARQQLTPGAVVVRGTLSCSGGLAGKTIRIEGLETTLTDVLVRVQHADGRVESQLLRPASPAFTLGEATHAGQRAWSYLELGLQHILLGVDHLLFVLGLLLIVRDRWMLVKTVTAFTVAHSLTLAAATLGYASVPLPPLNAAVAVSILFLGLEIVRARRGESSFTIRHPWVVAFAFGLLHGFGFASGLTAMGLPKAELPLALLLFNVGVEIGQLAFVAGVLLLLRSFRALQIAWPRWQRALPGYCVGSLGAYWAVQRVVVML